MVRFEFPLVLLVIPLPIGLLYYFTRTRSIVSFLLRSIIIILLVFILAGFQIKSPPKNIYRIYLIDDSANVFLDKDKLLGAINENIKQLGKNNLSRILYLTSTNKTVTNIEKALLSASASFPAGYRKEIFLFSDGNQTQGDAMKVCHLLEQEGIILYTIAIGPKDVQDIKINYVDAPKIVREGQPIEFKCIISSANNTTSDILISANGKLIRKLKKVSLLKNQDNTVAVTLSPQTEPIIIYEIKVFAQGINEITPANNVWKVVVQKIGKPKVLYIPSIDNQSQRIISQIVGSDFAVDIGRKEKTLLSELYDIIICDNISLASTPDGIRAFVSNGGGLLVLGGQNSFGLGNYQNSDFEKILPVYATPSEDLVLVIILDASGSMDETIGVGNIKKFNVASRALTDSITLLSKSDRLEVIVFNQGYETLLPLKLIGDGMPELKNKLLMVKPTGPTAIVPPVEKAIKTLTNITSAKKHIILLSDGYSTTNEPVDGFRQIAAKLKENNITISCIATGERTNEDTLKALTGNGSLGKIYRLTGNKKEEQLTTNLKDALSVKKEFYRERDNLPVSTHSRDDILKGIDNVPAISGYNRTTLKPDARLVASVGNKEPFIAVWNYGLGKAMVLTTSLDSQWMRQWQGWDKLGQLITQSLRYLSPLSSQEIPNNISISELSDNEVRLAVEVSTDGLNLIASIGSLVELSGNKPITPITIKIPQIAIGKYEATIKRDTEDALIITIFSQNGDRKELVGKIPVVSQYAKEWRKFGPDTVFLRNLAEATGGRMIQTDELNKVLSDNAVGEPNTYKSISSILIVIALVLFLIDLILLAYRRM